jgi:integrase/cob(I)alamin adenosyltransferase
MDLSVEQFLDSVSNPNTKKEYRHGIKKFREWYGKSAEEILELRKTDLTQTPGEGLIEYRNRAARFEREIEKFHSYLLTQEYTINTARNLTLGIRQLFRYYEMGIRFRVGSKVSKTVKTTRSFPLTIEHVRVMFQVADLRERVILSMATDLGLRIGDFLELKKTDLPSLNQEAPVSFDILTSKEDVIAHSFLSQETLDLLKVYVPTLERKNGNPYLFPSNGKSHISDEWMNRLLQNLADKARIDLNGKDLTFHCFRKMFLSASVDSGIGLTAGKKLCGKSIAQSDDTYLTAVNLGQKFVQLKKFLGIREQPILETGKLESLKAAISRLQEDLTQQRTITDVISEENLKIKEQIAERNKEIDAMTHGIKTLQPFIEVFDSLGSEDFIEHVKNIEEYMPTTEIPLTPRFERKLKALMEKKGTENTEIVYLNELFELSRIATLEDEVEAKQNTPAKKRLE